MHSYVFKSFSLEDAFLGLISPTDEPIVFTARIDEILKHSGIPDAEQERIKGLCYVPKLEFIGRDKVLKILKLVYMEQKGLPIEYLFSKNSVFTPSFYVLSHTDDSKWSFTRTESDHYLDMFKLKVRARNLIDKTTITGIIPENDFPMQLLVNAFAFFDLDKDDKLDEIEFIGFMCFLKNVKAFDFTLPSFLPTNFLRLVRVNPYTLARKFTSEFSPIMVFIGLDDEFCITEDEFFLYASDQDSRQAFFNKVESTQGFAIKAVNLRFFFKNLSIPESIFKSVWRNFQLWNMSILSAELFNDIYWFIYEEYMKIELGSDKFMTVSNMNIFLLELKEIAKVKYSSIIECNRISNAKKEPDQKPINEITLSYNKLKKEFKETYDSWLETMKDFDGEMGDIPSIMSSIYSIIDVDKGLKEEDLERDTLISFCGNLKSELNDEVTRCKNLALNRDAIKEKIADTEYIISRCKKN